MSKDSAFDVEYGWDDENGNYYYMNRVMGFKFPMDANIPEEFAAKPNPNKYAKEILTNLLAETEKFDTKQVDALNLKEIAERTRTMSTEDAKQKYVVIDQSAYDPRYLKMIRRMFRDAIWYVRPDRGMLSNLYIVDRYSMQTIGVLLPMRIVE